MRWVRPDAVMAHPFEDGTAIALHRDLAATVASLDASQPGAGAAWGELIEQFRPLAQPLVEAVLGRLPPLRPPLALAAALRRDGLLLARRMMGSVEAFGLDVFSGARRPTAWLAGSAQHSGLPPSTAGSGAFGFLLQLLGHSHGWPFPAGGQGEITSALLEDRGSRRRARALPGARRARRWCAGGARWALSWRAASSCASRDVVSTISARPLAAILPEQALPERLLRRLRDLALRNGRFQGRLRTARPGAVDGDRSPRRQRGACGRRAAGSVRGVAGLQPRGDARAAGAGDRPAHDL